jgi:hypothetical protein
MALVALVASMAPVARAQPVELTFRGAAVESDRVRPGMVAALRGATGSIAACVSGPSDVVVRLRYARAGTRARVQWIEGPRSARACVTRELRRAVRAAGSGAAPSRGVVVAWWSSRPASSRSFGLTESSRRDLDDGAFATSSRTVHVTVDGAGRWGSAHTSWLHADRAAWMECYPSRRGPEVTVRVAFDRSGAPRDVIAVSREPLEWRALGMCIERRVGRIAPNRALAGQVWLFHLRGGTAVTELVQP